MASEAKKPRVEQNGDHISDEIIEKIDDIQNELDKINESASVEILAVEKAYSKRRQPFYKQRADMIRQIPLFWSTALRNHPAISALITAQDAQALTYLEQLDVEEFDDIKSGFKITLTFNENPYFTNKTLSKSVFVGDQELSTVSDAIQWKEGGNFVETLLREFKALQNKSGGGKDGAGVNGESSSEAAANGSGDAAAESSLPQQVISFVQWFGKNEKQPQDTTIELGEVIKDDLWPNPLQYYFASEGYEEDDDEEDEDEEDDEDEEEEGEENEDEEDIEEELEGEEGDDK